MAEINLAPIGAGKTNGLWPIYNLAALVFSAIIIFLSLAGFIFFSSKKNQAIALFKQTELQDQRLQTDIIALDPDNIQKFQDEIGKLSLLMEEHIYWSRVLPLIEQATISTVWYDSLAVSLQDNTFSLNAKAKNLDGAARQLISFKNKKEFNNVKLESIGSGNDGGVDFALKISFPDKLIQIDKKTEDLD